MNSKPADRSSLPRFRAAARDCAELLRDAVTEAPNGMPAGAGPGGTGGFAISPGGRAPPQWASPPAAPEIEAELAEPAATVEQPAPVAESCVRSRAPLRPAARGARAPAAAEAGPDDAAAARAAAAANAVEQVRRRAELVLHDGP